MGIIEEIKSLATQIGTDVKSLRDDKANKNDFDRVVTALNNIADGLKGNTTNNQAGANTNTPTNGNTVRESFAQRVVNVLKENHVPFLNSMDDDFSKFVEYAQARKNEVSKLMQRPKITFENGLLTVEITPNTWSAVNVKYTVDGENYDKVFMTQKKITDVVKYAYRECDYYGVFGEELEKTVHLEPYIMQLKHPENYVFEGEDIGSTVNFRKLIDNSNYGILDLREEQFYLNIARIKAKEISKESRLEEQLFYSIKEFNLNGVVKVAISDTSSSYKLGLDNFNSDTLKNNPKYLVLMNDTFNDDSNVSILGKNFDLETSYHTEATLGQWADRKDKVKKTKTAIYRWDSTQNKYMFESADTLEDWLKEHPLDTL